jgi:SAM-dependent methyltransferase
MLRNRANRASIYSTAAFWDEKAVEFDGRAVSMWRNQHLNACYHTEQLTFLKRKLGDVRGKRVLDVGCGTGRIARSLADQGAQVVGIDFAPRVIEIARKQSTAGNPCYRVQSLFDLDEEDAYDLVVSWGSVAIACKSHDELRIALGRLHGALRQGGELLLLEPIHGGFLHRVLDMDTCTFSEELTLAGFDVRSVDQLHFWPARLLLAFVPWPRMVTVAGYHAGQWLMGSNWGWLGSGDYKGVHAVLTTKGPDND